MDVKDYKNAIIYYKKELEQYEDIPSEVVNHGFENITITNWNLTFQSCRTILNIANALEEDGATYYELEPLYQQALEFSVKADNPRLKATTLNSLAVLQEMNGYLEKSSELHAKLRRLNCWVNFLFFSKRNPWVQ